MLYLCRDKDNAAPYLLFWITDGSEPKFGKFNCEIWWHPNVSPFIIDASEWDSSGYPTLEEGEGPLLINGLNLAKVIGCKRVCKAHEKESMIIKSGSRPLGFWYRETPKQYTMKDAREALFPRSYELANLGERAAAEEAFRKAAAFHHKDNRINRIREYAIIRDATRETFMATSRDEFALKYN